MSCLTIFEFESCEVRFVGTPNDPWWVAADVCSILDIDTSVAVNGRVRKGKEGSYRSGGLDDDEKGTVNVSTLGGNVEVLTVNEPGLYKLVSKSQKPIAKRFQRWIYHEVLPSIRKTGVYSVNTPSVSTPTVQDISDLYFGILGRAGLDPRLIAGVALNAAAFYNPALLPAVEIGKSALSIPVRENLVRPTQLGEELAIRTGEKWSAIRVNKLLVEQGFQSVNADKNPAYLPTEKGKPHSQIVLDTAKGRDKTVQSLQWHLSILDAIEV